MNELIIDANNAILGRLASYTAKQALLGKKIIIVNCEGVVIIGRPRSIINEYKGIRQKGGAGLHGPFFPRESEKIVKRTVRGMLAYKQARGREALKRVICYKQTPEEYKDVKKIIAGKEKRRNKIKLVELSNEI